LASLLVADIGRAGTMVSCGKPNTWAATRDVANVTSLSRCVNVVNLLVLHTEGLAVYIG
jgi:hypothetical protein